MMNKSNGNMYQWVTHTWNTIKGECPHGCEYCYMKRWGKQKPVRLDESELKTDLGNGNTIFVGSSCDMWARDIPTSWIQRTLRRVNKFDGNDYVFQSKRPGRILSFIKSIPSSAAIGTTIETNRKYKEMGRTSPTIFRAENIGKIGDLGFKTFVTIEPIMDFDFSELCEYIRAYAKPKWVNIGANTSNTCKLSEPDADKINNLVLHLQKYAEVKIKPNLDRILAK